MVRIELLCAPIIGRPNVTRCRNVVKWLAREGLLRGPNHFAEARYSTKSVPVVLGSERALSVSTAVVIEDAPGNAMKLRVKENSLTFRVTRSELMRLHDTGRVEETVYFSADQDSKFVYALELDAAAEGVTVRYRSPELSIVFPVRHIEEWMGSDRSSAYSSVNLGTRGTLEFVIEKDYGLLEERSEF